MDTPISKADITHCRNGVYECGELGKEIERMQACDLNCDEQELRLETLKKFFQNIQTQYGPLVKPGGRG